MTPTLEATQAIAIRFGAAAACAHVGPEGVEVHVPLPVLAGPSREIIGSPAASPRELSTSKSGRFHLRQDAHGIAGVAICPIQGDLETQSYHCYRELFDLLGTERHAYRVWHYVPGINDRTDGLENYRIFNIGRRRAFDDHFGKQAEAQMPAASAVGMPPGHLVMAFVGGLQKPHFLENPHQTPAYHYPETYGPKSPSFARAALASSMVYISGTASIRGHATVHQGDLLRQLEVTTENLHHLVRSLGYTSWKDVTALPAYNLKVYLRHASDWDRLRDGLTSTLGATPENTTVLHTDICRADLDLEIEAVFSRD